VSVPKPPAVIHASTQRGWRGGEQQLAYLHERLAARGVPQVVVCAAGSVLAATAAGRGMRHVAARRLGGLDPLFARALARACQEARADLVHAHDPHAHAAAVLARTMFGGPPCIIVSRRVVFPIGRGPLTRWKYDHAAVRSIICSSRAVAETLRGAIRDPARLRVVHDAIDAGRFEGKRGTRLRDELGVPAGAPLVGTVAALTAEKDPLTFVEAAAALAAVRPDARFVVFGEGPLRAAVEARSRALGIEGRLRLAGFRDDLPEVLPELDLFLFTSRLEGLGTSILDAQASRVPVVATAAGGIPEAVLDGETGLLAPVGDAAGLARCAARLLEDASLRGRVVDAAARRVREEFGTEVLAERTLAIYREVLSGSS
jgi:glycosyltransferase involved in cell wall biosynthesis